MKVIIIEDEPKTAKELKRMLTGIDQDIIIANILPSVNTAIKWFRENPAPDLIFSDIQLGDGLCFDIFREVQVNVPVIFCTAYDEYAVQAFESNSIDYLLKPIEENMLERGLKKFQRIREHYSSATYTNSFNKALLQIEQNYKQSILVHYREKIIPVKAADIYFVHVGDGSVILRTFDKQEYAIHYTIDQLEGMLHKQQFFRANRQFIINRDIIRGVEHYFNRRLLVDTICPTPEKIIISRLKAPDFLRWLES